MTSDWFYVVYEGISVAE